MTPFPRVPLCAVPERGMNKGPAMKNETWPEFVTDADDTTRMRTARAELTGWETVIFELDDADLQEWESAFSTAALTP